MVWIIAVAWLDYITGPDLALSIFYVIPIAMGAWYVGGRSGAVLSVISALAMLLVDFATKRYESPLIPEWNAAVRLTFFLVIAYILRRRKVAEDRVRQLMRVKSEFTSMVAHELRTPLASIKEGLAMVLDQAGGPLSPKQHQYLSIVKRNVDRLGRLVSDVLNYQKLEAGRMEYAFEACDLNMVVTGAVNTFAPMAAKVGLELRADVIAGLPTVMCDKDKITQVISNLVDNALKFSERGCVRVTTERIEGEVRVAVHDEGMGIRKEDVPRLFEGFSRLEREGDKKSSGTGLGLAIAKRIVAQHQGQIGVESVHGQGSTFYFTLPIKSETSEGRRLRP
jgi:signal transduction histidine kinase